MARVVYSFSVPEESSAAWLLRKWKQEGKTLSHVIQNAIEYGAKEQLDLKRELGWSEKNRKRAFAVLKGVFDVYPDEFQFEEDSTARVLQPIDVLERAKKALDNRSEFVFGGGEE